MTPELQPPARRGADRRRTALEVDVRASEAECAALARRMAIPAVHALSCRFDLCARAGTVLCRRAT